MCILIFSVPSSVSSYFPHYTLQHTVGCTYTTLMNLDYFKYDLLVGKKLKTAEDHYRLDQQVAKPSMGLEVSDRVFCSFSRPGNSRCQNLGHGCDHNCPYFVGCDS